MEAANLVGNDETVFVLSSDLISRITAQTCRQSGLSVVYSELLQFEGDEIYFSEEKSLIGKPFKDAIFAYETSSVIGIFTAKEEVLINPAMDTILNDGDKVIAISEDDDTVKVSGKTSWNIQKDSFSRMEGGKQEVEKTLILGWNARGIRIIEELDNYVSAGSEVVILADVDGIEEDLTTLQGGLEKQKLTYKKGDIIDRGTLESLDTDSFHHIILLSYTKDIDVQESDAKTLICLLHLRAMSERSGKDYSIVSEMLDIKNRDLGVVAKADDFIVSDNLISLMLSQLSENKDLKKVYDILFEADGSEIYLKPVSRYIKTNQDVNFYTIMESAAELNEVAFGYKISKNSALAEEHFGVKINPNKSETVRFDEEDYIIVLAED